MSFEIDGETWVPQTATEHAEKIIEQINNLLSANGITDSEGNIVQLKQNYGNALYLLALGDGNRFADNDEKLEAAINSFNIELCDDAQIENLLPIAAVSRNSGSYSTLNLTCTASEDGDCTIPAGTKAVYGDYNFLVDNDTVISAGSTQVVSTTCDTIGPVAVLTGEITSFSIDIANLEKVENLESSVPGVAAETTSELRKRLIAGDTIKYSLDGCKSALEELTGISYARVYFNYNTNTNLTLPGGVELQPRHAYIVVHGISDKIAETYSQYMSAETQNSPIAEGKYSTVAITITASTNGNATIPAGTTATYNGYTFSSTDSKTIEAGRSESIIFKCTVVGNIAVPAYAITNLDETIENVSTVENLTAATPGANDPKHSQNWVTTSGQIIPIYYDDAQEVNVFIRVWLKENAESGTQVDNQICRDLIVASSSWKIGEDVTQLLTSAPFVNCTYTDVAYTEVSLDGETWNNVIEIGCNTIPRVLDTTIVVEQLGD